MPPLFESLTGVEKNIDTKGPVRHFHRMHTRILSNGFFSIISAAIIICATGTGTTISANAKNRELIKNGTFASGLAGWTVLSSEGGAEGTFTAVAVAAPTPITTNPTAANPSGGTLYALSEQTGSSYQILAREFRIPKSAKKVSLSYQMFAHSLAPAVQNPLLFDFSGTNQQARVDLLKGSASLLATTGLVRPLYTKGADAVMSPAAVPYTGYRFKLTRKLKPGRTYQIRFSTTVTEGPLLMGVDNVSVKAR